jgi:CobQ/CobB/MinD/ParA nucleotide binding domain
MIFTLYSYKGGVGRSMALANVAHWLYLRGLTVLMVDWDLEAPGLETFFYQSADKIDLVRSHLGVIDLLTGYCRQFPYLSGPSSWDGLPPVESYLCEIEPEFAYQSSIPESRGRLLLLSAGWRSGPRFAEYAEAVHAFDWANFYTRFRGQEYFNWFRGQLLSLADVVLVDSRTGITEMGGVCTRQLADVVVSFSAPNSQNLQGVLEMADSFQSEAVTKARGVRLEVLILPARIDDQDSVGYNTFRSDFVRDAERFTPAVLRKWKRSPWDLAIPYKAQYSYGEKLATGVEGSNEKVEQAYKELATHIAFFSPQGSKLWNACLPEMKPLAAVAGIDLSIPPWQEADAVVAQFNSQELVEAQRVLLRLVHLSPQSPSLDSRRRSTSVELNAAGSAGVIERLTESGVIARVEEADAISPESFELAQESVVTNWPRLREWIEAQRPLLLWRQDLAAQAAKWMAGNQDPALLLRGTPLREAAANSSEAQLNAAERLFVDSSLEAEGDRERIEQEQTEQAKRAEEERQRIKRDREKSATFRRRVRFSVAGLVFVGGLIWIWAQPSLWYTISRTILRRTPEIQIVEAPPSGQGGPNTTSKICGKVSGVRLIDFRVVLYAFNDKWYIQPTTSSSTPVNPDGNWCTVTHLGESYAALLVLAGFEPANVSDRLPQIGGDVVAIGTAQSPPPGWVVPSLDSLSKSPEVARIGYTRFDVMFTPEGKAREADHYYYAVKVNDQPVYFDGFLSDRNIFPLQAGPNWISFALGNLNLTGQDNGFENLQLTVTFLKGNDVVYQQDLKRTYVALRDVPGIGIETEVGKFVWAGKYVVPTGEDQYEVLLVGSSVCNPADVQNCIDRAMQAKKEFDGASMSFNGQQVVVAWRPPLRPVPGGFFALGLVLPTKQVKYTFNSTEADQLCHWAQGALRTGKAGMIFQKDWRRYNVATRGYGPCE